MFTLKYSIFIVSPVFVAMVVFRFTYLAKIDEAYIHYIGIFVEPANYIYHKLNNVEQ